MSTTRININKYPKEYHALFQEAVKVTLADCLKITFETKAKAKALRRALYTFREALYEQPKVFPSLTEIAPTLAFRLRGTILMIYNKDKTPREELRHGDGTSRTDREMQVS